MSGSLRPSAGYIGRGVTDHCALEYMLYHQNSLAQVNAGSRRRPLSQTFSPATSRFDCRHSQTSDKSRKYPPLATMPCSRGKVPVRNDDCTVVVTAGVTVSSGRMPPRAASRCRFGACGPSRAGVSPTTLRTRVAFIWLVLLLSNEGVDASARRSHLADPRGE